MGRWLVREIGGEERLNVETSEGLNVEEQKRAGPCRKKKGGGEGMRRTRERIAHLNEDAKCFTANGRK